MVKWFLCEDNNRRPVFYCRGESAEDCRFKAYEQGIIETRRIGPRVTVHCYRERLPDIVPLVFTYCYQSNGYLFCKPNADNDFEIRIPAEEIRRAILWK